jgi:cellulose biosynthesis protein BcsQ
LTVNALVCADRVLAPVSAEDAASVHGIGELRTTLGKLAARLEWPAPDLWALVTRWAPLRVSSRAIYEQLVGMGLEPVARVSCRSALVARAAAAGVPMAVSDPDSSVAIAYAQLAERLLAVSVR